MSAYTISVGKTQKQKNAQFIFVPGNQTPHLLLLTRGLLSRGASPAGIILMYHRVNDAVQDPWELCVAPANFEEHLEVLRKYSCVPLEKMEDGKRKDRYVALTFEDGYADNLHVAIPMLEHFDMPAAFFITTGGIGSDREF